MASDNYFMEIEGHFAMRRGTPFILSPKDWVLMKKWRDDAVPLPIVIEAIDSVFEKNETSGRNKKISSLSYCRHAVKELWSERRDLYAGASGSVPEAAPAASLDELASRIESIEIAASFAPRIRALIAEKSVPAIENALLALEAELIEHIMAIAPDAIASIREEVAKALAQSPVDEKTRARTEEANLRRLVREKFELPRLTMFG
jgi:hypothetical protein